MGGPVSFPQVTPSTLGGHLLCHPLGQLTVTVTFLMCLFWWVVPITAEVASGEKSFADLEAQKPFQQGGNIFSLGNTTNLLVTLPPIYIFIHWFIYSRDTDNVLEKKQHRCLYRQTVLGVKPRKETPPPGEPPAHIRRQLRKQVAGFSYFLCSFLGLEYAERGSKLLLSLGIF